MGDARSDEAGDVRHRLDGLDLDAEQDGLRSTRRRTRAGRSGAVLVAQAQSVGPAPAAPPDRAVVGEVERVLDGRRLHDLGNERAGDAEVEEAADLVGVARVRDAQLHGDAELLRRGGEADQLLIAVGRVLGVEPDEVELAAAPGGRQLLFAPADVAAQGDQLVAGGDARAQVALARHVGPFSSRVGRQVSGRY